MAHYPEPSSANGDRWHDNDLAPAPDSDRWQRASVAKRARRRETPPRRRDRNLIIPLVGVVIVAAAVAGAYFLFGGQAVGPQAWLGSDNKAGVGGMRRPDQSVIFSGRADQLTAAPGNTAQDATAGKAQIVWVTSDRRTASPRGATDGVSVKLPDALARQLEASRVRVTVRAGRAEGSASPFAAAYSVEGVGNSGWIVFTPTLARAENFSFVYTVPRGPSGANAAHHIGIWADISGGGDPLAVWEISVEKLS